MSCKSFMVCNIACSLEACSSSQEFRKEEVAVSVLCCAKNRINFEDPSRRESCFQCKQNNESMTTVVSLLFNLTETVCGKMKSKLCFIKKNCNEAYLWKVISCLLCLKFCKTSLQVGAALRPAFAPETPPDVTAKACQASVESLKA